MKIDFFAIMSGSQVLLDDIAELLIKRVHFATWWHLWMLLFLEVYELAFSLTLIPVLRVIQHLDCILTGEGVVSIVSWASCSSGLSSPIPIISSSIIRIVSWRSPTLWLRILLILILVMASVAAPFSDVLGLPPLHVIISSQVMEIFIISTSAGLA